MTRIIITNNIHLTQDINLFLLISSKRLCTVNTKSIGIFLMNQVQITGKLWMTGKPFNVTTNIKVLDGGNLVTPQVIDTTLPASDNLNILC